MFEQRRVRADRMDEFAANLGGKQHPGKEKPVKTTGAHQTNEGPTFPEVHGAIHEGEADDNQSVPAEESAEYRWDERG